MSACSSANLRESPTRADVRRAFWLASLLVPGWAQLMAGRWSAWVWLVAAALAWGALAAAALTGPLSFPLCAGLCACVHLLSAVRAFRLCHG